jgi:alpha-L-fucosidase
MKLDWHRYPGHMQIMTNTLGRPIPQFDFYTDLPAGENHTFESDVINLMETIGFKFNKSYDNNGETKMAGVAYEYKYYPEYFTDKHYTLILFYSTIESLESKKILTITEHRLYIHNSDGSYNDSPYQLSSWSKDNRNYIMEKINKIFSLELRDQKLNKLIYEN